MILRTIKCDICGISYTEDREGAGFPGWGALQGVSLDDVSNPSLCPGHLAMFGEYADKLKQELNRGLD